ncbi:MAG: hypothetical protein IPF75_18455 [Bacteroidetes bacterium]|nr:hypothetical protein [Bacteroidota bacterium]
MFVAVGMQVYSSLAGSSNTDSVEQANDMNDKKDSSGSMMTIDDNDAEISC